MEMEIEPIEANHSEDSDNDIQMFDEEDEQPGNPADEAQEVPDPGAVGESKVKPKRVIKNPQPKLDAVRLMGPRGVGIIQSTFKEIKFKGKGHEKEDLKTLMKKLEHWAHRLFPKMPFDDTLKQIEKLGTKKNVQNMMKRIRLDMFQSDELNDVVNQEEDKPENNETEEVDVFDKLLSTGPFGEKLPERTASQNVDRVFPISQAVIKPTILTAEQRERMERNRLLALERRRAKLLQQQQQIEEVSETNGNNIPDTSRALNETSVSIIAASQPIHSPSVRNTDISDQADEMDRINSISDRHDHPDASNNETDCPHLNEKYSVAELGSVSSNSTKPVEPEVSPKESIVNPSSKDTDMVTEDDLLGLINTEESKT